MFELSRDYERAWQLMQQGDRLACWVDYEVNHKDIACAYQWKSITLIAGRGTHYIYPSGGINNFEEFLLRCKNLNIEFYLPLPDDTIVISPENLDAIASKVIEEKVGKPLGNLIALTESAL